LVLQQFHSVLSFAFLGALGDLCGEMVFVGNSAFKGNFVVNEMRIVSFLPAATEMICALGLADQLTGVSRECDYPAEVSGKPVVVRCAMDLSSLNLKQIDQAVSERAAQGKSIYAIDENLLRKISPTLIVTQDLCQVCAPSGNEASKALTALRPKPEILYQTPHSFEDVLNTLIQLGEKTGTSAKAEKLVQQMRQRISQITAVTAALPPVKVFFMEWVDPIYCGGHWVPEMISWAGGMDEMAKPNQDSVRVSWEEVVRFNPDLLIVSPCGFNMEDALHQAELLKSRPGWESLKSVKNKRVFVVDADAYFARPGPRLVDGTEILAHLIHPELFLWKGSPDAFTQVI
jgi:iron complex transport system substrate-binding protein